MASGQLSFFSAAARAARPDDVEGLLCGPGQIAAQGPRARVSVVVALDRAAPLAAELLAAGLTADEAPAPGGLTSVRTGFASTLSGLAQAWSGGSGKRAPAALVLDGPRLRLWAVAAGEQQPGSYRLRLGQHDDEVWSAVGAALAAAGLPAVFVGPRADGPAYRITGVRRLDRLRELVGDRPDGVDLLGWP